MSVEERLKLLSTSAFCGVASIALLTAMPAYAQDADDVDEIEEIAEEEDAGEDEDRVIVTGSRIKRDTFNSIAPVQVISGEVSRELGVVDAAAILQDSTASTGQQIDQTFNGFVLDNGPGASTVSLRALGADRTLVLLNGRRVAPAGVEGAPSAPDLNLIPGLLTERIELLLDGASSVYGSDAVAGVANVILRRDFDGLEIEAFRTQPEQEGGEETVIAASWGFNNDRGFAGFGFEYSQIAGIRINERDYTNGCDQDLEITDTGEIRSTIVSDQFNFGMEPYECNRSGLVGRAFIGDLPLGSVYFTPGTTNTGIPNFSETNNPFGGGLDSDGDGINDLNFSDYSINATGIEGFSDLLSPLEQFSATSYGEFNVGGPSNATVFYEAIYAFRRGESNGGPAQLFPDVPGDNPFNPCNPNGLNGINCVEAYNDVFLGNDIIWAPFGLTGAQVQGILGEDPALGANGLGIEPIVSVRGDRNIVEFDVQQFRSVFGVKGELPWLESQHFGNFEYELSGSYTRSTGQSIRRGIREDRLVLSLETSTIDPSTGEVVCGLDIDGDGIPDPNAATEFGGANAPNCVPVNLFAPSLYDPLVGNFATQAERDYLFGRRTFTTGYEQTVILGYVTYDGPELQGGRIKGVLGAEFRRDEISSEPDDVAEDGLFFGFFSDGGADGEKDTREVYGELELPILAGKPFAEELTLSVAGRLTDDEFYDSAWTYSTKLGYRPVNWLLLRGTYGTSFRSPNLRENFLRGQSGFLTLADPCVVPTDALVQANLGDPYTYDPLSDGREQTTIDNCIAAGLDPFTLGANLTTGVSNANTSVEIRSGGSLDLDPETSDSYTVGLVFEQPWLDKVDFRLGVSYYSLEVTDSIAEPGAQFIINDCYNLQANLSSSFCSRIQRGVDQRINLVDAGFININSDTAKGVDFNIFASTELQIGDKYATISIDLQTNWALEQETILIGDNGNANIDDNVGEFGNPEFNGLYRLFVDYEDWRVTWSTRFIDAVSQDPEFVDPFSDAADTPGTGFIGNTCLPGDCVARDIGFADRYFTHTVSVRYSGDTWSAVVGVRNVFDQDPPLVNGNEVFSVANVPIGAGYDILGRTLTFNLSKRF